MRDKKDNYQQYLEKKHASFSTNPELLAKVVSKATGSNLNSDQRIVEGEVNEVHRITTNAGQEIIVRISRSKKSRFEAEKWAIEESRKVGVPAPEVLLIEKHEQDGQTLTFCVQNKIDGIRLRDYVQQHGIDSIEVREAVNDAGVVLSKLHRVRTGGYGNLNPDGSGKMDSWEDYISEGFSDTEEIMNSAVAIGIEKGIITTAQNILSQSRDLVTDIEPHLLHGDYGMDHIFIKDGKVSGIIDFEGCKGGDTAWDFGWWSYFGSNRPSLEWLIEGYQMEGNLGDDFERRIIICKLRLGLDMVWYYHHEKNEAGQNLAKQRLEELVKEF